MPLQYKLIREIQCFDHITFRIIEHFDTINTISIYYCFIKFLIFLPLVMCKKNILKNLQHAPAPSMVGNKRRPTWEQAQPKTARPSAGCRLQHDLRFLHKVRPGRAGQLNWFLANLVCFGSVESHTMIYIAGKMLPPSYDRGFSRAPLGKHSYQNSSSAKTHCPN